MKLFAIYIGGSVDKSIIELHDMRFVAAETIEETYDSLRKGWWGTPESLHLDAWGCVTHADGYEVHLKKEPPQDSTNKLYFVNLGGYDDNEFTELHKNVLVVAPTDSKAKVRALRQVLDWKSHHRDYQFEVENVVSLDGLLADQKLYIHLNPTTDEKPFEFTCKYVPIGRD